MIETYRLPLHSKSPLYVRTSQSPTADPRCIRPADALSLPGRCCVCWCLSWCRNDGILVLRAQGRCEDVARCLSEHRDAPGYGTCHAPKTDGGKVFAGVYAPYAGLLFLVATGLLLTPIFHRLLHRFHWEQPAQNVRPHRAAPSDKSPRGLTTNSTRMRRCGGSKQLAVTIAKQTPDQSKMFQHI